jgi:hypothetical protein
LGCDCLQLLLSCRPFPGAQASQQHAHMAVSVKRKKVKAKAAAHKRFMPHCNTNPQPKQRCAIIQKLLGNRSTNFNV